MANEDNMNNELEALAAMTEAEACKLYNVDYKDEAFQYIVDYWTYIAWNEFTNNLKYNDYENERNFEINHAACLAVRKKERLHDERGYEGRLVCH